MKHSQTKITDIKLYAIKSGDSGARGAAQVESQYWGGGWQAQTLISNPMSIHPKYSRLRSLWMGGGQDPYVIETFTNQGVTGFCANYGGGALLLGVAFKTQSRAASLARAAEELSWRVDQATALKLTVAIEPHRSSITGTPDRALQLAALVHGLGFTLDYAHFTRIGIPDSRIEPLIARATHFHACCARKGRLQSSFTENTIDFGRVLDRLSKNHFNGWIALEYVWIGWEHCNEVDVLSETIQLREFLNATAKKISRRN